jgi:hypothetical protein
VHEKSGENVICGEYRGGNKFVKFIFNSTSFYEIILTGGVKNDPGLNQAYSFDEEHRNPAFLIIYIECSNKFHHHLFLFMYLENFQ